MEHKKAIEAYYEEQFTLWWDSWIEPALQEIESKQKEKVQS